MLIVSEQIAMVMTGSGLARYRLASCIAERATWNSSGAMLLHRWSAE
jgi:hypothetical protein